MPHTDQSVLSRVGQGLISFGSGRSGAEIETIRADRDIAERQAELGQQQVEVGQEATRRQQEVEALIGIAMSDSPEKDQALSRLFQVSPELADQVFEGIGAISQSQREEAGTRALEIQSAAPQMQAQIIRRQAEELRAQGRDPKDTESLLTMSPQDLDNALRFTQAAALSAKERATGQGAGASKLGQSVVVKDPITGETSFATPVLTGGQVTTQQTPISGEIVSRALGETSAQRQARDVETAGGRTTATAAAKRDQEFIDVGQRQADSTAIIRRGIQLLDVIKTGTPEAIALAATNLLGITGADETELNANLGKAVLSQLRSTFGAQFTESEGKRLAGLEAGFGKSTAGNKRLLEQTLKSMERDARRGIEVARRVEDEFSATEIERALEFDLTTTPDEDELPEIDPALLEFMTPEERAEFGQ